MSYMDPSQTAYLLEDMQANKMAHKSELMVYINVTPENKSTHI